MLIFYHNYDIVSYKGGIKMAQEVIGFCPICNERLITKKLSCNQCGLELTHNFSLSKFSYLSNEEIEFIEQYLKHRGNVKILQKKLNTSSHSIKKQLDHVLFSLGLEVPDKDIHPVDVIISELPIYDDESYGVKLIKRKLNNAKGRSTIALTRDKTFDIYYEPYGNGIIATNIPKSRVLTWKAFDCAIDIISQNGGKALKGQAMKSKVGEDDLPLTSVEGYVAYHAYGVKLGESTIRTISALSGILDWAGICKNGYGYLEFKASFKE